MTKKILSLLFFVTSTIVALAQPITQYTQFNGPYDFVAIGNTLNVAENNSGPCTVLTSSSADLNLDPDQTVIAAFLYWAGSAPISEADLDVELNGTPITAERVFDVTVGLSFFGAFADVTTILQTSGNGTYTLSEFDLTHIIFPGSSWGYCGNANFAGWSIVVIYEDPDMGSNQVSIYDGFEIIDGTTGDLNINLTGLNVIDPLGAKIGFMAWEGDVSSQVNESVRVNGNVLSNLPLNPPTNAFNCTNSYSGAADLWNMDLDYYSIEDYINIGDTGMLVTLTSGLDRVIVHNIVVSVSSELPDATIVIDEVLDECDSRDIEVAYTVYNINCTDELPASTPIVFYADGNIVGTSATVAEIPIDGSESGNITLSIPGFIGNDFVLTASVDDVGDGTGIVNEIDETNNTFDMDIHLRENPIIGTANTIIICDLDNDGHAQFYLLLAGFEITGGDPDLTVTYHLSEGDAIDGIGAIPNPEDYTNVDTPIQVIWVRVENLDGCYSITSFEIEVRPAAYVPFNLDDLYYCVEGPSDIGHPVDLTVQEPGILGGADPDDYTITYHLTQLDAMAGTGAFPDPTNYANIENPQEIWVRLVDNIINCVEVGSFWIHFFINPPIIPQEDLTDYELCDDNIPDGYTSFDLITKVGEIAAGNTEVAITFHLTEADAMAGVNILPYTDYTNVSNPQTIYAGARDINNGCVLVREFDLIVHPNPIVVTPSPFEFTLCDTDNDGIGEFNFDEIIPILTSGDPLLTVTFHETLMDAHNGLLPIVWPYTNLYNYQPIYIRVENENGCYTVVVITLIVYDSPVTVTPDDLILCDEFGTNTAVFDLTLVEPQLMSLIEDPSGYSIEYYETEDNAQNGTFPIPNPTSYVNLSNPQQIWVVVTDIENGCRSIETFFIGLNDLPELTYPVTLTLCDYNNPGDMMEAFNLELATPIITGGNTSLVVTYHESQADAESGENALDSPYTNVLGNPQNIWIRVVDTTTGCVVAGVDNTGTDIYIQIEVLPLPSIAEPPAMEVCDPDGNGYHEFYLDEHIDIILGGEPNVNITFHQTWEDANAGVSALPTPYENIVAYEQTIYVRAENINTGCYVIVELLLIVHTVPEIPIELPDLVACSVDGSDTGVEFDLTQQNEIIIGSQAPDDYTITYYESLAAAESGTPAIGVPESYFNTSNPQTIWVRIEHIDTECYSIGSFDLIVTPAPAVAAPEDIPAYEICGDGETAEFDLTTMNLTITLGDASLEVQHYESQADAQNQENQIDPDTSYTNITNPQTIYVRVYDADTGCEAYTHYTIGVLPNPTPNTDIAPIEECDTDGDGYEEFDLTERELEIIGADPDVSLSYYESLANAQAAIDPILNETAYTNIETPEQVIYVRVEKGSTGCYAIVELLLRVIPIPDINEQNYVICEVGSDGYGIFDLQYWKEILLNGQDPTTHTVSYHYDSADAEAGENAIPEPDLDHYPNTSNPQLLYVRITHTESGCYVTGQIELRVQEGVTITEPAVALEQCEDALGSGMASFDLTVLDEEILGGQQAPIQVDYYSSEEEALAGVNPIEDYTDYYTTSTTIWARVTNPDPNFEEGCYEIVPVELIVNPLPEIPGLLDEYRLCVDAEGNAIEEEFGMSSPPVIDTGLSTPAYEFEWYINGTYQPGEIQGYITATQSGTYTVKIINGETRCENEYSTQVYLSSPPIEYRAVTSPAFSGRHSITVLVEGLGDYQYSLDDGPFQESNYFEPVSPGTHIVTITDKNGCGTVRLEVTIIDYPQFFTPNEDGYHDSWNIIGIEAYPTAKIYIFDRYGKLLKQLSPTGSGWDGTYNGRPLPSNDYWFRVEYEEDGVIKNFRGHITLKR